MIKGCKHHVNVECAPKEINGELNIEIPRGIYIYEEMLGFKMFVEGH